MSEKELIASWDNEYGVDWHILRPMVTKALRNKTGYLTVGITKNGMAQLFFEQTTEGSPKTAPSPNGGRP